MGIQYAGRVIVTSAPLGTSTSIHVNRSGHTFDCSLGRAGCPSPMPPVRRVYVFAQRSKEINIDVTTPNLDGLSEVIQKDTRRPHLVSKRTELLRASFAWAQKLKKSKS